MWKHCDYSSWVQEEGARSVGSDTLGSSSLLDLIIKTQLLFLLCYFYSYLSWLSYLQIESGEEWRCLATSRLIRQMDFGSLTALFGPLQKNSSVGVLESALPLGNNTTTHIFWCLLHTMCTFLCVIPANRNRLWRQEEAFFMTQIPAQEWAHLVIKRSHRKARCPCGVSAAFSSTSLFLCVYLWGKHYRNWQGWSGLQQRGECCRSVLMSEAFSGLSKNRLDRSIDQGLSKPVNMPPSETPELPPSPLHTQLKGDGLQPLWSKDTPFFSF